LVALVFVLAACKQKEQEQAPPSRPNVVVITVDTLRADHLGCYGFEAARTPHIDALASQGVRAEHAIAATPITLPSHATIFTGLYPPAHGVRDNGMYKLPEDVETLAERLKAEGYRTQAFVSAWVLHHRFNLDQGFDGYDDVLATEGDPGMFRVPERSGEDTIDAVLKWLDSAATPSQKGEPFFLWVHLFDPHQPYAPPEEDAKVSPTLYDGEIASADRQLGRFIEKLQTKGVLDDTILVFTSDHGESLGEHGEASHSVFIYEATVRVPLIVRYPPKLPAGSTYPASVRSVDLVPTILGLAELKPMETQGVDLSKAMAGKADAPMGSPYSESMHPELEFGMAPLHGIRSGQWTYIRAPRPELYDRSKDPGETRNLLEDPDSTVARAATAEAFALDARVTEVFEDSKRFGQTSEVKPIDAETAEMLKALGYMSESDAPRGVDGMDPKDGNRAFNELDEARQFVLREDYASAKKILVALLERVPTNASARNLLATCEVKLGNPDVVEELYLQSLAHEPRQPELIVQLGRFRLLEGKQDAARARFIQALEVDPAYIEAMMLLGYLERLQGRPEEAMRWYAKAIAIDPAHPAPYLQYGDHYFRENDFAEAKSWYEKALKAQPDNFAAAMQAGTSAMNLGDANTAEGYFVRANRIEPSSWKPFYNLACLQVKGGDANSAFQALQNAVTLGFDNAAQLTGDVCWVPLRADPRFAELVRQLQ
jgi:arylsulfatase A-like enzyme/tetratricopeptide (TPR) repeat protein